MAKSIGAGDNVVGLNTGRKRGPKGGANGLPTPADRKAAAEAAFAQVTSAGNTPKAEAASPVAPAASAPVADTAPGLGHNRADEAVFLKHVQAIRRGNDAVEAAKLVLKEKRGELKDLRQLAKADGLVLKDVDEAMADAATERVDLIEKEERRRKYREWLGLPVGLQGAFEFDDRVPEAGKESAKWWALGNTDGRLGLDPKAPDWCPPDRVQDYLKGHEAGQLALMQSSPLTAGAFDQAGELKADNAEAETDATPVGEGSLVMIEGETAKVAGFVAPAAAPVLILHEEAFAEGTALEDANRSTLREEFLDAWTGSERIVAVFAGKRRILKEPAAGDEEAYEDTGTPDAPVSEVEDDQGAAFA